MLKLVKGKSERIIIDEPDLKIQPGEARELLISALKVLSKHYKTKRQNPLPKAVGQMIMRFEPETVPAEPSIAVITPTPCRHDLNNVASSEVSDEISSHENGRRFVTTATGVATNPITGMLHYVRYPVYYPTYPTYYG